MTSIVVAVPPFHGAAGFVVVNVPLQSKLKVGGRIVAEGGEVALEATGVSY